MTYILMGNENVWYFQWFTSTLVSVKLNDSSLNALSYPNHITTTRRSQFSEAKDLSSILKQEIFCNAVQRGLLLSCLKLSVLRLHKCFLIFAKFQPHASYRNVSYKKTCIPKS